jgi:hypothetical protein
LLVPINPSVLVSRLICHLPQAIALTEPSMTETNDTLTSGEETRSPSAEAQPPPAPVPEDAAGDVVAAEASRPCHALESLFVDLNIRFAVGLALASPVSVEVAHLALAGGLRVSGLDRLAVVRDGSTHMIAITVRATTNIESAPMVDGSLTVTLEGLVARSDVPALGTVHCYLLTTTGTMESVAAPSGVVVVGVVVNANHALCDGRLLQTCMGAVADAIGGENTHRQPPPPPAFRDPTVLRSLHDELTLWSDANPPPEPRYHPLPHESTKVVRLSEIPYFLETQRDDSTKTRALRRDILGNVIAKCHHRLHSRQATITGLMAACWIQAIHEAVLNNLGSTTGDGTPVVTVSCLVALHSQLLKGLFTNAFGTGTLAGESVPQTDSESTSQQQSADRIIDLAAECTRDLRCRIDRGEAASQGLALRNGEFDLSLEPRRVPDIRRDPRGGDAAALRRVRRGERPDGERESQSSDAIARERTVDWRSTGNRRRYGPGGGDMEYGIRMLLKRRIDSTVGGTFCSQS